MTYILTEIKTAISNAVLDLYGVRIELYDIVIRPTPKGILGDYSINIQHLISLINKYVQEPNLHCGDQ